MPPVSPRTREQSIPYGQTGFPSRISLPPAAPGLSLSNLRRRCKKWSAFKKKKIIIIKKSKEPRHRGGEPKSRWIPIVARVSRAESPPPPPHAQHRIPRPSAKSKHLGTTNLDRREWCQAVSSISIITPSRHCTCGPRCPASPRAATPPTCAGRRATIRNAMRRSARNRRRATRRHRRHNHFRHRGHLPRSPNSLPFVWRKNSIGCFFVGAGGEGCFFLSCLFVFVFFHSLWHPHHWSSDNKNHQFVFSQKIF
jgi:hypothetical protein